MIYPFSITCDPVEFELKGLRVQPSTFDLLGNDGETRISRGEVSGPIKWKIDTAGTVVKALITGSAFICGEHENETSRVYSITISGPQAKLQLLQDSLFTSTGFALVA